MDKLFPKPVENVEFLRLSALRLSAMFYCWREEPPLGSALLNVPSRPIGGMAEWLKAHAWKACIRQKRIVGSNPTPSANCAVQ